MIKRTFQVRDMHCPNCAMKVEAIEDNMPGVIRVFASYQKGEAVVEFDESLVSVAEIVAAVKQVGYSAEPLHE